MANEFIARKGLIVSGSTQLTGSLNVSRGITGSLFGTSSWASNVISSSFATTASAATSITFTPTTASYAATSSVAAANTLTGTTLASNVVNSSLTSVGTLTGLTVSADATINSVIVGRGSGNSTTNTVVGNGAFTSNTTGTNNTVIGTAAMTANTTGTQITAIGVLALNLNTVGVNNVAVGNQTLTVNTSGSTNTAIGVQSLFSNTLGNDNTGVGVSSLRFNTVGTFNTAMGTQALRQNVTGSFNSAYGNDAARFNVSGSFNTAIGSTAMYNNTSGSRNTALGYAALYSNTTSDDNTAIGRFALYNSTGTFNIGLGRGAGSSLTTGNNNTIIGGVAGTAGMADTVIIGAGATERLRIDSSGNMGIGTTAPGARLHVQGNISASSYTGSLFGNATTATSASFAATASFVNILNQTVSASGNIEAGTNLISRNSSGDEGGEINLARPQTNSGISGSVVIDVNGNRVRIFEGSAPNRGGYWDITTLGAAASTNLAGGTGTVTSITAGNGLTGGTITGAGTITLDTGSAHFTGGVAKVLVTSASFATTSSYALNATATVPDGTVSSSLQFNSLTLPFTGSFTGSFKGDGTGLTGVTVTAFPYTGNAVISGSLIITGSNALSITGSATVLGAFQATTKSFKIDHQLLLGKKLIYGVLEGPEHGVYVRGRLTKNNIIQLPEEWEWLIDPDSITVQLTPIGIQQILYVQNIENNTVIINSNTPIDCFYFVQATRKDVAPLTTVE